MSESLKEIDAYRKSILVGLYNKCTVPQQDMFRRIFSHKNPGLPIEDIIDAISPDKINSAITLCERTIEKNNK